MKYLAPALFVIWTGLWCGFSVYSLMGFPPGLLAVAMAGGVASVATLTAGLLWRARAKQKPEIILAPDKWPCQDFAVCTEAERRADLLAMSEGRITLEEWQERRRARPSPPRVKSDAQWKEDVRIKLFKEIMKNPEFEAKQPACRKCLGIHETETCPVPIGNMGEFAKSFMEMMGVGKYVTVEELSGPQPKTISEYVTGEKLDTTMPPAIKPGDRVRGIYQLSSLYQRIGIVVEQLFDGKWGGRRAWRVSWGGDSHDLYEHDFILALPRKGEVWNYQTCANCEARWKNKWDHNKPFDVDHNWTEDPMTRCRVNCGCLYRIGEQS